MLWVIQDNNGKLAHFMTACCAPDAIDDATALAALRNEMAAEFAHDGVIAYSVAFPGKVRLVTPGSAVLRQPPPNTYRQMVVIEAHDGVSSRIAVREIIDDVEPHLGPLLKNARATGRFGGLLSVAPVTMTTS